MNISTIVSSVQPNFMGIRLLYFQAAQPPSSLGLAKDFTSGVPVARRV